MDKVLGHFLGFGLGPLFPEKDNIDVSVYKDIFDNIMLLVEHDCAPERKARSSVQPFEINEHCEPGLLV